MKQIGPEAHAFVIAAVAAASEGVILSDRDLV
jgi:hypothetical protein